MDRLEEDRFRRRVNKAIGSVKTILENARNPDYADAVPHSYDDKYYLAEFLTNAALAAQLNVLELLGLTEKSLKKLISWAQSRSVTIRLKAEERCVFDREETRKVESVTEHVTEVKGSIFGNSKRTDKVITKITEYFWKFNVEYELFVFQGNDPSEKITLQSRSAGCELITTVKNSPQPEVYIHPSQDVNITWLLNRINPSDGIFTFAINRKAESCRTPRRNSEIESALSVFGLFHDWCNSVESYFRRLFAVQQSHALNLSSLNDSSIFVPVLPLFENLETSSEKKKLKEKAENDSSSKPGALIAPPPTVISSPDDAASKHVPVVLPASDVNNFLWEQKRSISEKFAELSKTFPAKDSKDAKLISMAEASIVVLVMHGSVLSTHFQDCVEYIENMLYKQLVAAIGKIVTPADFANYMRFHNRKLFRSAFEPRPFCQAIRRPDHYPEGTISIESQLDDGSLADPIFTTCRKISAGQPGAGPMRFPINAATEVVFGGDRFLHGWVSTQWQSQSGQSLSLIARARQFSSFILVVGRIAGPGLFDPKAAIIIQNKDDLRIPLLLETIPTPKEFRDAISSLSPEQQRFCKAFRSMQLESTLFGLAVIQIKPQLEKLLNLQYDSLTKEIRLTQDLMELFMKYQVPSDLLSFDIQQFPNASESQRISAVKSHVKNMFDMINSSKDKEIAQAQLQQTYAALSDDLLELRVNYEVQSESLISRDKMKEKESAKGGGGPAMKRMMVAKPQMQQQSQRLSSVSSSSAVAPKPVTPVVKQVAKPVAAPAAAQPSPQPAEVKPKEPGIPDADALESAEESTVVDFTKVPADLDRKFDELDPDSALRPTIINTGTTWSKKFQKAILGDQESLSLSASEQGDERNRTFDLLDALSRSGSLPIEYAELHVVVAATHCFEKSVVDTVVQDSINPIEKVERSVLIVSTTVQDRPVEELVRHDQLDRVRTYSPMLFEAAPLEN
eukprot:TRINITY_DN5163_c0_g1_i1.p1 TRINITY_DN5163_c0_g1~~TRINITY_DN5163_c0_g1_i1.p1  ORF type:complete len:964 (-),score=215.79 TRINITY_DN5163_c0_g1_i1:8-2899(-)